MIEYYLILIHYLSIIWYNQFIILIIYNIYTFFSKIFFLLNKETKNLIEITIIFLKKAKKLIEIPFTKNYNIFKSKRVTKIIK